jgi:hypothetical protein
MVDKNAAGKVGVQRERKNAEIQSTFTREAIVYKRDRERRDVGISLKSVLRSRIIILAEPAM